MPENDDSIIASDLKALRFFKLACVIYCVVDILWLLDMYLLQQPVSRFIGFWLGC
mgnify:CR=1 FL=1